MTQDNNQVQAEALIEDDPIEVRKAKREALYAAGKQPYGMRFDYDMHVDQIKEKYATLEDGVTLDDRVKVAGRIMAIRKQGKIMFMVLREREGDIQLFCRVNFLGEEAFGEMKDLDMGDWIGVEGNIMRSKASPTKRCAIVSVTSTWS